jgi:hypothetical protein
VLAACSANGIEGGVYHSPKGYAVTLPDHGWQVQSGGAADLELKREAPPGGMLADATCDGREPGRPLSILARHLTFGLTDRTTIESDARTVGGRPAAHQVLRGSTDGAEVLVEAVVVEGERCIHDFLYVAPVAAFDAGRPDFAALVESLSGPTR